MSLFLENNSLEFYLCWYWKWILLFSLVLLPFLLESAQASFFKRLFNCITQFKALSSQSFDLMISFLRSQKKKTAHAINNVNVFGLILDFNVLGPERVLNEFKQVSKKTYDSDDSNFPSRKKSNAKSLTPPCKGEAPPL